MGTVQFGVFEVSESFWQRVVFWDLTYRNIMGRASSPTKMNVFHCLYAEILEVKVIEN